MYIVTVEFDIQPSHADEFCAALVRNAASSREREIGCRRFDVARDPEHDHRFFLFEIYDQRAAFDEHLASEHYRSFDLQTSQWVDRKSVRFLQLIDPAS